MDSLEWVTDERRFASIAADWDRLAAEAPTPFLLSAWLLAWWRTIAAPCGLTIAVLWRDGLVVAGLPLQNGRRRWEAPVEHGTPPFSGMIVADDASRDRLATEVLEQSPPEMMLRVLPANGPALGALVGAAGRIGRLALVEQMPASLVAETTGSFDDYRAGLSSKVRSELGRLHRKAAREHRLELSSLDIPRDIDSQWARAVELEAAGWKGRNGTALVHQPAVAAFFEEVTRALHARGILRLSELSLDGELAAVALSILHRKRCFTLKVAYDETHRRLGPGFVLLMAMIERCFELGLEAYEFSGTEEEYERRFATADKARRRLRIYRRGLGTGSRYVYHRTLRPRLRVAKAQLGAAASLRPKAGG